MVLSTAYFPPIEWFAAFISGELLTIEALEHYQKGTTRNRCLIGGPNGVQRLSIPLEKGKHQQTPIRDVRISYTNNWQQIHWRSIKTAYSNAPYFEYYAEELEAFYQQKTPFLFDFNEILLHFALKKMGWKGTVTYTETYAVPDQLPPFQPQKYPQVFEDRFGFQPGLSVLDALMCCGKHIPL